MTRVTNQNAISAFRKVIADHALSARDVNTAMKPYAALLGKNGSYRDTVAAVLEGRSDEHVEVAPKARAQVESWMRPSPTKALAAFDAAIANRVLSAVEVKKSLEPYAALLRQEGPYRDRVAAVVQGRADEFVKLSLEAEKFFKRVGIL